MASEKYSFPWMDGSWQRFGPCPVSPSVSFTRLPCGVRLAFARTEKPAKTLFARLYVQAGSMMEEASERGFAHFVEHLAFEGSRHFPQGNVIDEFPQHGLQVNASTSRVRTVYEVDRFAATRENLAMMMAFFRDIADGLAFREESVAKERQIILAERLSRFEPNQVVDARLDRMFYAGTRCGQGPGGRAACIRAATPQALRAFWSRWYRPERMVILVAGDGDFSLIESVAREAFEGLAASQSLPLCPIMEGLAGNQRLFAADGTDIGKTVVAIKTRGRVQRFFEGLQGERQRVLESLADNICSGILASNRFRFSQKNLEASYSSSIRLASVWVRRLTVAGPIGDWREALATIHGVLASLAAFPVPDSEMARARRVYDAWYQSSLRKLGDETAKDALARLLSSANWNRLPSDMVQVLGLRRKLLTTISAEDVRRLFASMLAPSALMVAVIGQKGVTRSDVEAFWKELSQRPARRLSWNSAAPFPYLKEPAEVVRPELFSRNFGTAQAPVYCRMGRLPNGLVFAVLPKEKSRKSATATLVYGMGTGNQSGRDLHIKALCDAASSFESVWRDEILGWINGQGIQISEDDASLYSTIQVTGDATQARLALTVLWTDFVDMALPDNAADEARKAMRAEERERRSSGLSARFGTEYERFFGARPGNENFSDEIYQGYTTQDMRSYLERLRATGSRFLVMSGFADEDLAIREACRLFGSLPAPRYGRPARNPLAEDDFPYGKTREVSVEDTSGKAFLDVYWKVPELGPSMDFISCVVATDIFTDLVRGTFFDAIRERKGLTYSTQADTKLPTTVPTAWVDLDLAVRAGRRSEALELVMETARRIRRDGFPRDFFERVVQSERKVFKDALSATIFWHGFVTRTLADPECDPAKTLRMDEIAGEVRLEEMNRFASEIFAAAPATLVVYAAGKTAKAATDRKP